MVCSFERNLYSVVCLTHITNTQQTFGWHSAICHQEDGWISKLVYEETYDLIDVFIKIINKPAFDYL